MMTTSRDTSPHGSLHVISFTPSCHVTASGIGLKKGLLCEYFILFARFYLSVVVACITRTLSIFLFLFVCLLSTLNYKMETRYILYLYTETLRHTCEPSTEHMLRFDLCLCTEFK